MFGKKENQQAITNNNDEVKILTREISNLKEQLKETEHRHKLTVSELIASHNLALKEKEFDLKHFKDEEISQLKGKIVDLEREKAVLENQVKMLDKIVGLNADIIDVKELVKTLINKLPEIKISSLNTIQTKSNE